MACLVFDCETDGIPKDELPLGDPRQPHLVQLAALLLEADGTELAALNAIVRPDGWTIPDEAARIHGITTAHALEHGLPEMEVVARFLLMCALADELVAHNARFDHRVLEIAIARLGQAWAAKPRACTMELTRDLCCLPPTPKMLAAGRTEHKPPKLAEAYEFLFDAGMPGRAHDAMADVRACAAIWRELKVRESRPAWLQEDFEPVPF